MLNFFFDSCDQTIARKSCSRIYFQGVFTTQYVQQQSHSLAANHKYRTCIFTFLYLYTRTTADVYVIFINLKIISKFVLKYFQRCAQTYFPIHIQFVYVYNQAHTYYRPHSTTTSLRHFVCNRKIFSSQFSRFMIFVFTTISFLQYVD